MTSTTRLAELLVAKGLTVATAESLTGGRVGHLITSVPGASGFYRGGVITYATAAKHDVLGVGLDLLEKVGAVSRDTALAMAAAVRVKFGADIGIATTGVAGPTEQEGQPVGTLFLAVAGPDGERCVSPQGDAETRDEIREWAANSAIGLAVEWLEV